jgi:hypothetical protein
MLAAMKLLNLAGFRIRLDIMRIRIQHFFLIPDPVHFVFHWCRDEEHAAASSGFRSLSLTSVTGKRGQHPMWGIRIRDPVPL